MSLNNQEEQTSDSELESNVDQSTENENDSQEENDQPENNEDTQPDTSEDKTEEGQQVEEKKEKRGKRRNQRLHRQIDELKGENLKFQEEIEQIKDKVGISNTQQQTPQQREFQRNYDRNVKSFQEDMKDLIESDDNAHQMFQDETQPIRHWSDEAWQHLISNNVSADDIYDIAKTFPNEVREAALSGNASRQVSTFTILKGELKRKQKSINRANKIQNSSTPSGTVQGKTSAHKKSTVGDLVNDLNKS